MAHTFKLTHRVEFSDTDAAGLAHFTAFFRWMEVTEHAFYRSLGGTAFVRTADGEFGVPRVGASCEYLKPLGFGEVVDTHLSVKSKTEKTIEYEFLFYSTADGDPASEAPIVARGAMTVVSAMRADRSGRFRSCRLPDALLHSIEAAT